MEKIIIVILFFLGVSMAQENKSTNQPNLNLSVTELLEYSTVRIEVSNGKESWSGTGFFFNFLENGNRFVPSIVTNKHVIIGGQTGKFLFSSVNEDGSPNNKNHIPIILNNFENNWIMHPDPYIDLAIMPIEPLLEEASKKGFKPFYIALDKNIIPSDEQLKELSAVEDVLMIGYPIGLWDAINNFPLYRKGITASHPAFDYNGKSEFLIDAACFPGSSGSPVFLANINNYSDKKGNIIMGKSRIYLLGILYAGPQYSAKGDIVVINVPTKKDTMIVSNIPTNLGFVIKSKNLLEFDTILESIIKINNK